MTTIQTISVIVCGIGVALLLFGNARYNDAPEHNDPTVATVEYLRKTFAGASLLIIGVILALLFFPQR